MLILLAAVYYGLRSSHYSNMRDNALIRASSQVEIRRSNVLNLLWPLISNTYYLSNSTAIEGNYDDKKIYSRVTNELYRFAKANGNLEQVRIIDSNGQELIRIVCRIYGGK